MFVVNESGFAPAWCVGQVPPHALSATVLVKGTFDLRHGEAARRLEEQAPPLGDVYQDGNLEKALLYPSDFALWKPRADLLLRATAHASKPIQQILTTFRVGSWSKSLRVIGDRFESHGHVTEPRPFTRMEISHERAFVENEGDVRKLPNIEDPHGFGPISAMGPKRRAKMGSYDKTWLQEQWPWFPKDFDWSHFNSAPADQQLEGYLRGDEALRFENLHAHPVYETKLPGIRVRWFLHSRDGQFREIPLHLDTLFVDLNAERMHLVWRGVTSITDKKLREWTDVLVASESLEKQPLTLDPYLDLLETKKNPPSARPPRTPAPLAPISVEPISRDWVEKLNADIVQMQKTMAEMETQAMAKVANVREQLMKNGIDPARLQPKPDPIDLAAVNGRLSENWSRVSAAFPGRKDLPAQLPQFEPFPEIPEPRAPRSPQGFSPEKVRWTRERVAQSKGDFAGEDLRGLDLSGLDLSGRSFRGARMQGADLTEAKLEGADLEQADLTEAKLEGAHARGARFDRAGLGKACLRGADLAGITGRRASFHEADLSEANLQGARLEGADLSGATLRKTNLERAFLREASIEGARAEGIRMAEADLTKLRASGATLPGAHLRSVQAPQSIWKGAFLEGADFSGAVLTRANFIEASLAKASFKGADLKHARMDEAHLEGASVTEANLFRGSLQGAFLTGAHCRTSNFYEVEFWEATIEGADFQGANLKGSKLA